MFFVSIFAQAFLFMKILITGASGFIGSFLVEKGVEKGYNVWSGMRSSSNKRNITVEEVNFIELNLSSTSLLHEQLKCFKAENGAWDYVIHAAGVTKCRDKKEFSRVNECGTKNLIDTLVALEMIPKKFIYLSSLSIYGPVREEQPYTPINNDDKPCPNTEYGISKIHAEEYIKAQRNIPYIIMRPTGVYGPRERDYFQMVQSIDHHIDIAVGYKPQVITFIYVKDLVKAIYLAIEKPVTNRCYFVSEPQGYNCRSFSNYIQAALGKKHVLHITVPLWLLKTVSWVSEKVLRVLGKASTLNSDKYKIMKQRNWLCDTSQTEKELGFTIDYPLERGVNEMIAWYKKENWI